MEAGPKESERRLAILAEGTLDFHHGKTATSLLRYRPHDVVAVIDSENRGETTAEAVGLAGDIPIVGDIEEAMPLSPTTLLIGIAPRGGGLREDWRRQILFAISNGLSVVSGLHYMLNDDPEFAAAAAQHHVQLIDVRQPAGSFGVAGFKPRRAGSRVITFVGSDCAVGKMTAALEVTRSAQERGLSAKFVATGQTGIMLEGDGIAIDRVIGDFMAGATEKLVMEAAEKADWVFVEGQGSLLHPAYSGVTLALLHGSAPDGMVLGHQANHEFITEYPVRIPELDELVRIHEEAAAWIKEAPVLAIALNTRGMSEAEAKDELSRARALTRLPVTDPIKPGGADELLDAILSAFGSSDLSQDQAQIQKLA